MKKQIYIFIGLLTVLAVFSVSAVRAQSEIVRAHIPFDFSVKNRMLAAGDYALQRQGNDGAVWLLRTADNLHSINLLPTTSESKRDSRTAKWTFRRYGDKYFLVGLESSSDKISLRKSRAERILETEMKNNKTAASGATGELPKIVTINAGG